MATDRPFLDRPLFLPVLPSIPKATSWPRTTAAAPTPSPHCRWTFKDMLYRQHFILSLSPIGQNSVIWEHLAAREAMKYSLNSMKSAHLPHWKSVVLLTRKKKGEGMLEITSILCHPCTSPQRKIRGSEFPSLRPIPEDPNYTTPLGCGDRGALRHFSLLRVSYLGMLPDNLTFLRGSLRKSYSKGN